MSTQREELLELIFDNTPPAWNLREADNFADALAPYIERVKAEAWDLGEAAGLNNFSVPVDGEFTHNPYRADAIEKGTDR